MFAGCHGQRTSRSHRGGGRMPRVRTFACRFEVLWLMQQVKEKFPKKKQKKKRFCWENDGKTDAHDWNGEL